MSGYNVAGILTFFTSKNFAIIDRRLTKKRIDVLFFPFGSERNKGQNQEFKRGVQKMPIRS